MSKVTILFADNTPEFLDTRAEFLEDAGYRVLKAYTLAQARQLLADAHIHMAILDIRLVNDDDEKDTSGLTLAKDPAYRPVPKIIITDYPTYEAVREALGLALDGLPPAVAFLAKKEGPEAMIQTVDRALQEHLGINWELEIQWDAREQLSFLCLAGLLLPKSRSEVLERAEELEDLFRRLFYGYQQIRLPRLFWHREGRFCILALARSANSAIDARVVVCGARESLAQECRLVGELAPETLLGARLDGTSETIHFGAAAYVWPDADLETVRPLRLLLEEGKERSLKPVFDHLLTQSLFAWHQRGHTVVEQDLLALYRERAWLGDSGLPRTEVERCVDALVSLTRPWVEVQRSGNSVTFHFPGQRPLLCPDPVAVVYGSLERYGSANLCCISPGYLTADNVLVDEAQRAWLTDFAQAGQAPQWWDLLSLEAQVRFDAGQAPDMLAWLEFEECLDRPSQLDDRLPAQDVVADLKTNVVLIEQIRRQAGTEAGPDLVPYEAGLLAWAVGAMARYLPGGLYTRAELMRGAHLLLAAGMIARRMEKLIEARNEMPLPDPEERGSGGLPTLILEKDGVTVRIGRERCVTLSGQVLKLFRRLYDEAGQVVPRPALVRAAFDEAYDSRDVFQERRLNQLVRRLREEIEPEPGKPRYINVVRGQGYRLVTGREDTD